jgi:hypothetical protein
MADDSNSDASTSTSSFSLTEHPRASSRNYEWYWENVGKDVLAHAMEVWRVINLAPIKCVIRQSVAEQAGRNLRYPVSARDSDL